MKRIAVVGIRGGWSTERLLDAVEERTGFRLLIDMFKVRLDLESGRLLYNHTDLTTLDAVMVKKIAPAYSPGVLDRLEMLRFLERLGVPVFSRASSMMRLVDRLSCTVSLRLGEIPMPPTFISEDPDAVAEAVHGYGKAVLKPLYSSKARGMAVVGPGPDLCERIEAFRAAGNQVVYAQKFVQHPGRDLGVAFLGGEYLGTYARVGSGQSWDTTIRSGGRYLPVDASQEIIDLAQRAQALFDMAFTCVDVVETPDGPQVYEVSAFGGFRGLLEAHGIDAAGMYADWVLNQLD